MKNIDIWKKIYELNCRLKAQLNSRSKYDSIPKNLDATELADWRLCTAYIDWVLDTVDRTTYGDDFRGSEILRVLDFYFGKPGCGVSSSNVKNFDQLLNVLSAVRWKRTHKSPSGETICDLSWEIIDRIAENKEAMKEA